jgi:excisionase family DNA binding protein
MISKHLEFLTTREASELLGVALTTIQLWVESGALPAWKTAGGHRRIPRKAVEDLLAEQSASLEAKSKPSQGTVTVLIVEDDPVERELYRLRFSEWQFPATLLLAENGFDGLLLAGRHAPDLILSDLSMPGMDGVRMIHHLRRQASPGSIIVITGLTPEEIESRGGLPPDIPVYPKPIPFAALRPVVQHHVLKKTGVRQRHDR